LLCCCSSGRLQLLPGLCQLPLHLLQVLLLHLSVACGTQSELLQLQLQPAADTHVCVKLGRWTMNSLQSYTAAQFSVTPRKFEEQLQGQASKPTSSN
jgi:hypothetical protein